ncbi:type I-E CRISPR-associated protein Cse1/CasA [Dactylosporangium fulvum]|uniref:Type I-E CRISPR-associated protein Cse1/CasA n=1 Tax=Dactylosporangium fulvum TaxID=53359 RepID=A0ABY5VZR2_9ACTN|nr:type I-E CRISPR-associated protein Cse1/CasA [Dactylosporangium fulvum]UWP81266.1 type I-E CRISPR-associated protein Cse1/CasA [Dactylosporangium fulvum]
MIFNLTTEPWIPVTDLDGNAREVGLAEIFTRSHTFRRIVGETPPMTAALYRLVLALAHRMYGPRDTGDWAGLWEGGVLPPAPVQNYFAQWSQRFDLLDPHRPFLQCAAVSTCGASSAAKLVPHRSTGNNTTLFDHTTASDIVELTAAEASRWLVTVQAFDPGGLKTPYRRDKSSEKAPCNQFGVALVEGATLRETLLLNLVDYDPRDERPHTTTTRADRPDWEADTPQDPNPDQRPPVGWTDLLTWPARRIWLSHHIRDGAPVIDGAVITPGTKVKVDGLAEHEWMGAYWRPEPPRKTEGKRAIRRKSTPVGPLLAVRLMPGRGLWRHARELLLAAPEGSNRQRPLALDRIAERSEAGFLPPDAMYTLRVFGQQLDPKGAIVRGVLEESVAAPVALLRAKEPRIEQILGYAVGLADDIGRGLRVLERDYRAAMRAAPSEDLVRGYWPRLPQPFDQFLRELAEAMSTGRSELPAADTWARAVRRIADTAAQRWAEGSPRPGRTLMAVGECYGRFQGLVAHLVSVYHSEVAACATWEEAA